MCELGVRGLDDLWSQTVDNGTRRGKINVDPILSHDVAHCGRVFSNLPTTSANG